MPQGAPTILPSRPARDRTSRLLYWCASAFLLMSCDGDSVPTAASDASHPLPIKAMAMRSLGSASIETPASTSNETRGAASMRSLGITIYAGQLARINASGMITRSVNPAYEAAFDVTASVKPGASGPGGDLTYLGKRGLQLYLWLHRADGSLHQYLTFNTPADQATASIVVKPTQTVTLHAGRNGVDGGGSCRDDPDPYEPPGYVPVCTEKLGGGHRYIHEGFYALSGSQTISVELASAELRLSADRSVVSPGQFVVFSSSISPDNVFGGHKVPWNVSQWRWVPDGGGPPVTVAACLSWQCKIAINESGTMYVDGVVNGEPQTQSVRVVAIPCPTGDSLLDEAAIRNIMKELYDKSNMNAAESLRKEFAALIVRNKTTRQIEAIRMEQIPNPSATNCTVENEFNTELMRDYEVLTHVHTHPYGIGEPATCSGKPPVIYMPGPSGEDVDWQKAINEVLQNPPAGTTPQPPIDAYIIDKNGIYKIDKSSPSTVGSFKNHSDPSCPFWPQT